MTENPTGNLDYAFPEGLHPKLQGLAWMIGHWEGFGQNQWPGHENRHVLEQVDVSHNGEAYVHYLLQYFLDDDGKPGQPLGMESGFWIPGEGNELTAVVTNQDGVAQTWYGKVTGLQSPAGGELATRIEMTTDAVVSLGGTHTAGQRIYGKVNNKMMFAYDRADKNLPLQPWLTGELERK